MAALHKNESKEQWIKRASNSVITLFLSTHKWELHLPFNNVFPHLQNLFRRKPSAIYANLLLLSYIKIYHSCANSTTISLNLAWLEMDFCDGLVQHQIVDHILHRLFSQMVSLQYARRVSWKNQISHCHVTFQRRALLQQVRFGLFLIVISFTNIDMARVTTEATKKVQLQDRGIVLKWNCFRANSGGLGTANFYIFVKMQAAYN